MKGKIYKGLLPKDKMDIDKLLDMFPLKKLFKNKGYETARTEIKRMYHELVNDQCFRETRHMSSSHMNRNTQINVLTEAVNEYIEINSSLPEIDYNRKIVSAYKPKDTITLH